MMFCHEYAGFTLCYPGLPADGGWRGRKLRRAVWVLQSFRMSKAAARSVCDLELRQFINFVDNTGWKVIFSVSTNHEKNAS
jgi:hypothetical protein